MNAPSDPKQTAEVLSVFDMLKVGVGPSSSHTLGPWRAVQRWIGELEDELDGSGGLASIRHLQVHLYGSLALTGKGHATDQAICLALLGHDPETIEVGLIPGLVSDLARNRSLRLGSDGVTAFDPAADIVFHSDERLPGHANGMTCVAAIDGRELSSTYYSVGGGFIVAEGEGKAATGASSRSGLPYPTQSPRELRAHCADSGGRIADVVWANEQAWRAPDQIREGLGQIWDVMLASIHRGCHTDGSLPGGLDVRRRAAPLTRRLLDGAAGGDSVSIRDSVDIGADTPGGWVELIRSRRYRFAEVLQWISTFAMAVNEENASLGRVVTAPTNGAAGVIPAVLLYHVCFSPDEVSESEIFDFLMVAGEIGTLFKKGATISAAMGGCQAEVGVSSAMAAAALTEALGGSVDQALMAAEIAMEHHLGLTCDPVGGLVQVPCIERNTMGAVKAINAAELALASDPEDARVTLSNVIKTLRETAEDMSGRYKETSQGGLAVNVSVRVSEC